MTNPNCRVLILSILRFISTKCCKTQNEKQTKNPAETTGSRYTIEILMSRTQKLKGLAAASLRVKTLNDNPYVMIICRIFLSWEFL